MVIAIDRDIFRSFLVSFHTRYTGSQRGFVQPYGGTDAEKCFSPGSTETHHNEIGLLYSNILPGHKTGKDKIKD